MKEKAVFNWSGGKDSALALTQVLQEGRYDVVSLLTTVHRSTRQSSMHHIPQSLLKRQAESIGIPLFEVELPPEGSMISYREAMDTAARHFLEQGITHFLFGDIFLHEVRSCREKQLSPLGIHVVEPLWGRPSEEVMEEFLASGLQTVVVTVTEGALGREFVGRKIDREFVRTLPAQVDVCGENGEYHTFCYDGDIFRFPVEFSLGEPRRCTCPVRLDDGTVRDFSYWFAPPEMP